MMMPVDVVALKVTTSNLSAQRAPDRVRVA